MLEDQDEKRHALRLTLFSVTAGMVDLDTGTPVDGQDYQVPFRFTGKLDKLVVELGDE